MATLPHVEELLRAISTLDPDVAAKVLRAARDAGLLNVNATDAPAATASLYGDAPRADDLRVQPNRAARRAQLRKH